ncbi:MAG: ABC transporter substrate-binding protein [Ignisphaera sp.]
MSITKKTIKSAIVVTLAMLLLIPIAHLVPMVQAQAYPREQTLIIGGAYWSMPPTVWNALIPGAGNSGIVGLIYEPLYIWVPIKPEGQRFIPWLAADLPKWIDLYTVEIKIRPEATWWDGQPITAEDVKFTFEYVPKVVTTAAWGGMANYITSVEVVDDKTVRIHLNKTNPSYGDFFYQLYEAPILPEHALKSLVDTYKKNLTDTSAWPVVAPNKDFKNIVASGMYRLIEIGQDYFIMERVDNWWGKNVKTYPFTGSLPAPKYIKGVVVYSNQVAANMLGAGELDWSCFYIPGGPDMVKRGLAKAFYSNYPYYLSANVAFLFVNTQKKPFNDPNFRKALYFAINIDKLISNAYEGGVVIKSNPVGFLPYWQDYLATDLIEQYGYKYDPNTAKALLDQAGYKDVNGDGWREAPDGSPIRISIIVPYGWTDWMFAAMSIQDDLRAVGIYAEAQFPDYGAYTQQIDRGEYDAAINNFGSFAAPSPYTLLYWAYGRWPPGMWVGNLGRYDNPQLRNLINQLGNLNPDLQKDQIKQVLRDIQKILLDEMPALPLWYNGYWFLASEKYWTGWPDEKNPYGVPTIWNGQWQHGGLLVLLNLRPAGAAVTTSPSPTSPSPTTTTPTSPQTTTSPTTPTQVVTVTVTVPTTVVSTVGAATVTATVTSVATVTTTSVSVSPTTTTVEVTNWTITAALAIALLIIGFAIGWLIKRK